MQKISTFLMFNDKAGAAMDFYLSVFKNSEMKSRMPGPGGTVMGGTIEIEGQEILTFNGGPHFAFSQGISLFVKAVTQDEIDYLYEKLSEGGEKQPCGWLVDRFGVSWQIVPPILGELLGDKDREKAGRVLQAMLKMHKMDIKALQAAYDND
jgi:predicted 3-demethylubiquinone-9 3-methyltransferase (glyoxalase superfamily)